jgi:hypothetical protein
MEGEHRVSAFFTFFALLILAITKTQTKNKKTSGTSEG